MQRFDQKDQIVILIHEGKIINIIVPRYMQDWTHFMHEGDIWFVDAPVVYLEI